MPGTIRQTAVVAAVIAALSGAHALHAADIATVKALYASASYEEALIQLKALGEEADPDEVLQYQAFCLIALGRTREAEDVVALLITRNPMFSVSERDLSPRFISLFETVRARVLPSVARKIYAEAKRSYDQGEFADALDRFGTLLIVVKSERSASEEVQALQQLAEGFQKLSEASLPKPEVTPRPPQLPPPSRLAPAEPVESPIPAARVTPTERQVFSRDDVSVRPPQSISRPTPVAPSSLGSRRLTGLLVLVIDEQGGVESATLSQPISPLYDVDLLAAARRWRFRPAVKDGTSVKYRMSFPITIR